MAVQTEQEENNEKCEQDIYNKLAGMINTLNNNYIHSIQALDVKVSNLNTLVMSVGESICNNNQMQFNMTPHNSQAIPSSLPDSQVVPGSSDEDMPNDISFMINDILSGNMSQSQESSSSTTYTGLPGMSDEMSPTFPLIPKKVMPGEAPENKNRVRLHLKIQALQCSKWYAKFSQMKFCWSVTYEVLTWCPQNWSHQPDHSWENQKWEIILFLCKNLDWHSLGLKLERKKTMTKTMKISLSF